MRNPFDKMVSEYKWHTNTKYEWPGKKVKDFYKGTDFKTFADKYTKDVVTKVSQEIQNHVKEGLTSKLGTELMHVLKVDKMLQIKTK